MGCRTFLLLTALVFLCPNGVSGDPISPTNGHADNHNLREEIMNAMPRRGVCDGADDCRRVVREAHGSLRTLHPRLPGHCRR